ncbi:T9SS type A sorting domain-containing protein, partial [candidate division KSB1 bacterium]|nr:T9SS type A sorting domain-containing protein [candidate division KSB1 bacterium]
TAEASPGLDLGYTILPISDIWMDQVMSIEKQSFPDTVLINQETEFTLQVQAFSYTVWSLSVTDELPAGWQYVAHSTNITFSNGNPPVQVEPTITGDLLNGLDLFWNLGYTIDPSESISITFRAYPTVTAALGINQNRTEAEGESGGNTFNPDDTDFIFVIDGGSIGDYIWNDLNADGVQDPGETGISGVKIALLDVSDDTVDIVYTDMNGLYQFTAIPPGDYSVHVDESTLPAGFFSTTFNDPLSVTLLSGETIDDADFGYCDNIGIDIEKSTNGQDADTPQGPVLTVGVPVTWEYRVVNTGVVPLANISVVDNDPGVTPVFIGGDDSPANNLLDPGETWVYQASDTAVAGQYQNLGTVNADYNGQPFSDNDPSHYFGSAPRIRIKKLINGLDVDAPPGPTVIVDDSLEWCFTVTNTGNVPLWNIAIADSDVSIVPVYQSGDLNSNDTLDVAEIWTYCVYDSARAGQIINIASVTGTADSVRTVADEDTSYYYGADSFDFGDAPAPYPTLAMNSGAVHAIVPGIFLGYSVDGDPDGQPSVDAQGDDIDGNNDDEGVQFTTLITGQDADLAVTASTSGYLNAWIDFNNDGDWQDPGEQVAVNQLLSAGSNQVVFPMPTAVASPSLFARFRFSSERDLSFNGYAPDGEVEDYLMPVEGIVPVELSAFTAAFEGTGVHLEWTTQSETENLGFHIYRSTEKTGLYNQITRKMIPGANNSSVMHQYSYLDHTVESGNTYYYKLVDINNEGGRTFHGPLEVIIDVPMHYDLAQNYPNPFNPATTIPFRIKESGFVQLVILNLNGQIVRELVAQHINAGFYEVVWDGTNEYGLPVTSGTYFYRMQVNGYQKIRKMVFMK